MLALWHVCVSAIAVHRATIDIDGKVFSIEIDEKDGLEAIARRSATDYCSSRRQESVRCLLLVS
jgi:hypothetical protein